MRHLNKINFAIIIALASLALNGLWLFENWQKEKIAYVRSTELVYGYIGMKAAHNRYKEKSQIWQANVDTLQNDYHRALSRYSREAHLFSDQERGKKEKLLMKQQENLMNYSKAINDKAKEEDEKTTQAVLNQINSFVEEFGKENGYDIILGTTTSGSLLYGKETIDITEDVLTALNEYYMGE